MKITRAIIFIVATATIACTLQAAEVKEKEQQLVPLTKRQKQEIRKEFKGDRKKADYYIGLIERHEPINGNNFTMLSENLLPKYACLYADALINPTDEHFDKLLKNTADEYLFDIALTTLERNDTTLLQHAITRLGKKITQLRGRVYKNSLAHDATQYNNAATHLLFKTFDEYNINFDDLKNVSGSTPLMQAVTNHNTPASTFLTRMGCDSLLKANNGISALQNAIQKGNSELLRLFLETAIAHDEKHGIKAAKTQLSRDELTDVARGLSKQKATIYIKTLNNPTDENFNQLFASYECDGCLDIALIALHYCHLPILKKLAKDHASNIFDWIYFRDKLGYEKLLPYIQAVHEPTQANLDALYANTTHDQHHAIARTASNYGHVAILEDMIKKFGLEGIQSDDPVKTSELLHSAAFCDSAECVQALLDAKMDSNCRNKHEQTPLHACAERKQADPRIAQALIDAQADVNALDDENMTPLYTALWCFNSTLPSLFLERKADANIQSTRKSSTILNRVIKQYPEEEACKIVQLLAAHKASPNIADREGFFPLDEAFGKPVLFTTLLGINANIDNGCDGYPPLCDAAYSGNVMMTELLIAHKANLQATIGNGATALHLAAKSTRDSAAITTLLVNAKAHLESKNNVGATPLAYSIWFNNPAAFDILLAAKADVAHVSDGNNILHMAAIAGNATFIDKILSLQLVNPMLKNKQGKTYQDILRDNAAQKTLQDIEQGRITRPALPDRKRTANHGAVERKEDGDNSDSDKDDDERDLAITPTLSVRVNKRHIFGSPVFNPQTGKLSGGHYSKKPLHVGDTKQLSGTTKIRVKAIENKPQNAGFYSVVYEYLDYSDPVRPLRRDFTKTYFPEHFSKQCILGLAAKTIREPEAQESKPVAQGVKHYRYGAHYAGPGYDPIFLKAAVTTQGQALPLAMHLDTFHPVLKSAEIRHIKLLKENSQNQ